MDGLRELYTVCYDSSQKSEIMMETEKQLIEYMLLGHTQL